MIQTIKMTKEEKVKMYNKLSKKELIEMLIEANNHLVSRPLTWKNEGFFPKQQTVGDLCPCNPLNGGSGICGCTMANQVIYSGTVEITTDLTYNSPKE